MSKADCSGAGVLMDRTVAEIILFGSGPEIRTAAGLLKAVLRSVEAKEFHDCLMRQDARAEADQAQKKQP